jgi:cytochrome c peroxidase
MKPDKKVFFLASAAITWSLVTAGAGQALAEGDPDYDRPLAPLFIVPVPPDNPITANKRELGRLLFFDPKLTGDASLSCASCHDPKQGWTTNTPISRGYPGTVHWRNTQTVVNAGYLGKLFWQGGSRSLEEQAESANRGAVGGNGERDVMESRLRQTPQYVEQFNAAFGSERPILGDAWRAIATFERAMLIQKKTPLDRYLGGDRSALSKRAAEGLKLFQGKANCIECHNGPLLSDEKYYNLGVPRPSEWEKNGLNTITFRWETYAKGVSEAHYRAWKDDAGLYYTTKRPTDIGKFRTPPLRYLRYTAPYMHAGQFLTLEEVIDFYDRGGGENEFTRRYGTKTPILKPLNLSGEEKAALVSLLDEASGDEIMVPVPEAAPYAAMPDVFGLTQARAKRIGLEAYLSSREKTNSGW